MHISIWGFGICNSLMFAWNGGATPFTAIFHGENYEKPLDLGIHHWTYQNPMHCVQIEHPTSLYCRWWIGVVFSSKNIYWSPHIELHQFWFPTVSTLRWATVPEWSRKLCPGGGNWCVEGTTERVWTAWGRGSTLAPTFIPPSRTECSWVAEREVDSVTAVSATCERWYGYLGLSENVGYIPNEIAI